ncbi:hypothetical protein BC827DRAFT_302482 [Russula dissimulans]|nr:hypothetical protein BC827DRAFT_302482 [Russula dissimulans]
MNNRNNYRHDGSPSSGPNTIPQNRKKIASTFTYKSVQHDPQVLVRLSYVACVWLYNSPGTLLPSLTDWVTFIDFISGVCVGGGWPMQYTGLLTAGMLERGTRNLLSYRPWYVSSPPCQALCTRRHNRAEMVTDTKSVCFPLRVQTRNLLTFGSVGSNPAGVRALFASRYKVSYSLILF